MAHTDKQWKRLEERLADTGFIMSACKKAKIPYHTYWAKRKRDFKFAERVDAILRMRRVIAEDLLFKKMMKEDWPALRFYLINDSRRNRDGEWMNEYQPAAFDTSPLDDITGYKFTIVREPISHGKTHKINREVDGDPSGE